MKYYDGNSPSEGVECRWGRQKSGFSANISLHCILWTMRRRAAINTIVGRYLAIDRCLLELVLSTDGRPSSGVSQSRCKSVYGTESHAPANTTKRREHNLIYAAVNLTREYITNNRRLRSTFCTIEANYWQTQSIERPFCDSRGSCLFTLHEYRTDFDTVWRRYSLPSTYEPAEFWAKLYHGQGSRTRQKIRIDVKTVLPHSERLHKFHSTYGTLCQQGRQLPCSGGGITWPRAVFISLNKHSNLSLCHSGKHHIWKFRRICWRLHVVANCVVVLPDLIKRMSSRCNRLTT